jgi:hypothetical protein
MTSGQRHVKYSIGMRYFRWYTRGRSTPCTMTVPLCPPFWPINGIIGAVVCCPGIVVIQSLPPPKCPPFAVVLLVATVIVLPQHWRGDDREKDGWMGEVRHAVAIIVVVSQAFDATGLSAQLPQGVICIVPCACVRVCLTSSRGGLPSDAVSTARWIHPPQRLQCHTFSRLRTSASPWGDVSWRCPMGNVYGTATGLPVGVLPGASLCDT